MIPYEAGSRCDEAEGLMQRFHPKYKVDVLRAGAEGEASSWRRVGGGAGQQGCGCQAAGDTAAVGGLDRRPWLPVLPSATRSASLQHPLSLSCFFLFVGFCLIFGSRCFSGHLKFFQSPWISVSITLAVRGPFQLRNSPPQGCNTGVFGI